ncbi:MAG: hypothetical protein ACHQF2_02570 [Flavobacteriales bacterium]
MKNSPDIFYLIHSLTPNEKGYFKKFCSRSGSRDSLKYLELFDLIGAQPTYDEEKLKNRIGDKRLLKNLSAEKNYLYNQILDSLALSGSSSGPREEVLNLLSSARVLFLKSLYPLVSESLEKIYKLCMEGCFYELLLEALSMELSVWQYLTAENRRELKNIFFDRDEIVQKIKLEDEAHQLNLQVLWSFTSTGVGRTSDVLQQREQWLARANALVAREKKDPCVRTRVYNLNTIIFLYNTLDQMENTRTSLRELITILEEQPILREDFMNLYASSLSNLILVSFYAENIKEGEKEIEKLRNLKSSSLRSQLAIFVSRMNAEFEYFKRKHDFDGACKLAEEMKIDLIRLESLIPFHYFVHMVYFAFRAYFYTGQYREALFWINYLTNSGKEITREEAASITRISEIILHYEMGHMELVTSLTQSAQRFLEKKNTLYGFEKHMLDFFREFSTRNGEREAFTELKKKLEPLLKDDLEGRVKAYFDFEAWVESKITGQKMTELIK